MNAASLRKHPCGALGAGKQQRLAAGGSRGAHVARLASAGVEDGAWRVHSLHLNPLVASGFSSGRAWVHCGGGVGKQWTPELIMLNLSGRGGEAHKKTYGTYQHGACSKLASLGEKIRYPPKAGTLLGRDAGEGAGKRRVEEPNDTLVAAASQPHSGHARRAATSRRAGERCAHAAGGTGAAGAVHRSRASHNRLPSERRLCQIPAQV